MNPKTVVPQGSHSPWHAVRIEEVLRKLGSSEEGLGVAEAEGRLAEVGPNVLQRARGDGPLKILWRQVNDPLIYVLLGAVALAILMGKVVDGLVVLGVVVLNTIIGFVQEYRAGKAIEALMDMVPQTATVIREGRKTTLQASEIVPGDIVELAPGDRVPADMRLLRVRSLKVEEAALTGESVPTDKATAELDENTSLADRGNMVYGGTLVSYGTGTAVVVATAGETELGRISSMLRETTHVETPLTRQLAVVGKWLTVAIVIVAAILFVVGTLRGYPAADAVLAAITLAVGAIPEGLPAIVTIALAIGVRRMAGRRAVIRRLPAVETLGSTTVICSDKTGTLTKNEMTVTELWTAGGNSYAVGGVGYAPEGDLTGPGGEKLPEVPDDARRLLLAGALCNDAALVHGEEGWRVSGDPTEGALLTAAKKLGVDPEQTKGSHPRLDAIPFDSGSKYMATLNETEADGREILVKGAPEVVLSRCSALEGGGPLDTGAVLARVEALAARGMRVLALASRRVDEKMETLQEKDVAGGLELVGLQGMIDPPRPEAVDAVEACKKAGISVKMITGDHKSTARAIGEQLGLETGSGAVTGAELDGLSDEELQGVVARTGVFARVAPEHKIRLVRSLQAQGHVVAMTGDGVNDAPALKQADIGVAMGITGTDVSKESSDIVLTDDNFASIEAAVEEGRRVYDNLIKALAFVLPTNIGLAVILTAAVAFFPIIGGEPLLPMLPTQILWINLVAAVALALPLAFEAKEPDLMLRSPRDPDAPVLSRFVIFRTVLVALLMAAGALGLFLVEFAAEAGRGVGTGAALAEAQTTAVTTVILFQIFYLLNCRSLRDSVMKIGLWSNPWIYVGIGALLLLQAGFIYLPFMNAVFGTAPLPAGALLQAFVVALVVLPVIGAEKWLRNRGGRKSPTTKEGD
ncbi:HAD-IC family P-type ATPase [Rubrobacter tropicus]|uniref:HAD-IC family P-type ATPase n=1 Tax=Rubrobacter tropicus TaxID=2653851 RepID=A0A6G8Q4U6_9ACTN|nr:HAD-IC family P-type ATPase [Rubrobacter tropicus]QIN81347.1 HAD-IC family P-type ATPase [Rubrobacter tropicus]